MKQSLSLLVFLLSLVLTTTAPIKSGRVKYNFNSDWRVHVGDPNKAETTDFDDDDWKKVTTPYAWNEDDSFHVGIANLSTGIAWYRKHFKLPASAKDKKVFLEFEGIRHGGEFYLNGKWIGRSENGVMAFGFDITDEIKTGGENVLAVRIDNDWEYREVETGSPYQWSDKNFYANYGGINKNVYLHVTDRLYQTLPLYSNLKTTGVYVYATNIDVSGKTATITAETQVRNEYRSSKRFSYNVQIDDVEGKTVKKIRGEEFTLRPNETKTLHVSGDMSDLNWWSWGYGYMYDVHTSLTESGRAVDTVTTRTGFRKTTFKDGHFSLNDRALHLKGYAQRTTNEWPALGSSVPPWLSDFSNNLVLESNGNLIRWMHVTPWKQDVESLDRLGILQAMPAGDSEKDVTGRRWEQRHEVMRDAIIYNRNNPSVVFYESGNNGITEDHMKQMKDLRDQFDPYGGRAAGCREMLNSTVAEYGGQMLYVTKSARQPLWEMEYSRDEGLRKYWDNYSPPYHVDGDGPEYKGEDASVYNRNQDSHAVENVKRWYEYYAQRPGTGTRVNAGGVNIVFSDSNTHYRGAENYRRSGEVDAMRLPKDGWYAHRVMWDNWVDVEKLSGHIFGHWNYNDSTTKNVYVASTAERVELFLNGKSLGWGQQSDRFLFTFTNVTWKPGELKAVGHTGSEKAIIDEKATTGKATAIRLTKHIAPGGFIANGADIALVDVEVVDARSRRVPTALNEMDFTLEGEASWRGGLAQGPDNYILATSLPVENGINRVMLRSTTSAGKIKLSAKSNGLKSASVTLSSEPQKTTDGLSTQMPGNDLLSNLSRGPTPPGRSYRSSRKAVEISSATAGSDKDNTESSYDDDERTQWSSDAHKKSAWIQYSWEASVNVSQVVLKLNDFRNKEYPVEVSVGDKIAWKGKTPKSLGYVTLDLNATVGKSATIALDANSKLGVLEAEVYAPAR
ncbi:beta-galactosidase [Aspergillus steynii IBT 23096]|uniref:Beta-galactosidase n=1 Tax=Aspergillus steynii IBT 23096 TaxID=1392250 RepID=A0A2I2G036_9EURO|nr:beta-galactosidase [Aspergillus steynii IBT 23096]PLB46245.1 beta-galactosidase [Aspergillus steynii IBT 23096]